MARGTTTEKRNGKNDGGEGKWEELPDPIMTDGFWALETGNQLEGVILEAEQGTYGIVFKVKATKATKCKKRGEEGGTVTLPAGSIVGVNENAKLRQLKEHMKRGPTAVRIIVGERRADGRGFDMNVAARPAF